MKANEKMVARSLVVRACDVVLVKGIVEAHDGVAQVRAEHGGDLLLVAPASRARELDEIATDLARELGGILGGAIEDDLEIAGKG